jgi:hypothetical protein
MSALAYLVLSHGLTIVVATDCFVFQCREKSQVPLQILNLSQTRRRLKAYTQSRRRAIIYNLLDRTYLTYS